MRRRSSGGLSRAPRGDQNLIHDNTIYCPMGVKGATVGTGAGAAFVTTGDDTGLSVYNNLIVGYSWSGYGQPGNWTGIQHCDGVQNSPTNGSSYIKTYNNTVVNMGNYSIFWGGGPGTHVRIYNNLIIHNETIMDMNDGGIIMGETQYSSRQFNDVVVANNLVDGVAGQPYSLNGLSGVWASGNYLANNIYANTANGVNLTNNTATTVQNNVYLNNSTAASCFVSWIANGLSNNYHLTASAASFLGVGTNLSNFFTTDKDGNARPTSGAWSIGPYASLFSASGPGSPTGLRIVPN